MSRNIWVTSDTHFFHERLIHFTGGRPEFRDAAEMNETMVERWNSVVRPQDKVYHLGDVAIQASSEQLTALFRRLNGHKRLLVGNHDHIANLVHLKLFERVELWRKWKEKGLLLTHVPVHQSALNDKLNVHGHIHRQPAPSPQHYCVCVEQTNYTPVNIEELAAHAQRL